MSFCGHLGKRRDVNKEGKGGIFLSCQLQRVETFDPSFLSVSRSRGPSPLIQPKIEGQRQREEGRRGRRRRGSDRLDPVADVSTGIRGDLKVEGFCPEIGLNECEVHLALMSWTRSVLDGLSVFLPVAHVSDRSKPHLFVFSSATLIIQRDDEEMER